MDVNNPRVNENGMLEFDCVCSVCKKTNILNTYPDADIWLLAFAPPYKCKKCEQKQKPD